MPFFYVPGNHDLSNVRMQKLWKEKFGRLYYHFVYRNVLFLILDSEDPPGKLNGHIGEAQVEFVRKVLEENREVRWTIVSLHRPLWDMPEADKTGWPEVEKELNGRKYTVFAGHVHRYKKFVRQGMNYYQLATTGGASRMRGVEYGEFDHLTWVTVKKTGPVLANVLLDGIYPEDMRRPAPDEQGIVQTNRKPTHPVRGVVCLEGCPAAGTQVAFHLYNPDTKKYAYTADGLVESDGSFVLTTYVSGDGAPVGEYAVTVAPWGGLFEEHGKQTEMALPEKYRKPDTTPLKAVVKSGKNEFAFELKK
jgi:hypothetical protein